MPTLNSSLEAKNMGFDYKVQLEDISNPAATTNVLQPADDGEEEADNDAGEMATFLQGLDFEDDAEENDIPVTVPENLHPVEENIDNNALKTQELAELALKVNNANRSFIDAEIARLFPIPSQLSGNHHGSLHPYH
jgi:hypothetical protein